MTDAASGEQGPCALARARDRGAVARGRAAAAWNSSRAARGWPALSWRADDGAQQELWLDPANGDIRPPPRIRQTEGGRHFMSFHYTLHGGLPGYWLVGWISMCMLVALISGVVVHKRIFRTLHLPARQGAQLDAHNATAVLGLPFLFMIGYTGWRSSSSDAVAAARGLWRRRRRVPALSGGAGARAGRPRIAAPGQTDFQTCIPCC